MTEAYPLHWPEGWPRTQPFNREWELRGQGKQTWNKVVNRLIGELDRLGATGVVLSTNQPLRLDGQPYAAKRLIDDPGVAVYFALNGRQMVMAQDRFYKMVDNIRSLALAIEGLRQMDRHGGGHMMERAFSGFEALPDPASKTWYNVLDLPESATEEEINGAYRRAARHAHPDAGGSNDQMAALNKARAEGLQARQQL